MGKKLKYPLQLLLSLTLSLTIMIFAVNLTLSSKWLYYTDISYLSIEKTSALSKNEIITNYNYIVDYVRGKTDSEFKLPTLEYSAHGAIHFKEVRELFSKLNVLFYITLLLSIIGIILSVRKKVFSFLKYSSIISIVFPCALLIPFSINFDRSFTIFHQIVFNNNYWLFDPLYDPIINILPETYFLHCALLILSIIGLSSIVSIFIYKNIMRKVR